MKSQNSKIISYFLIFLILFSLLPFNFLQGNLVKAEVISVETPILSVKSETYDSTLTETSTSATTNVETQQKVAIPSLSVGAGTYDTTQTQTSTSATTNVETQPKVAIPSLSVGAGTYDTTQTQTSTSATTNIETQPKVAIPSLSVGVGTYDTTQTETSTSATTNVETQPKVAIPSLSVGAGTYDTTQTVTIAQQSGIIVDNTDSGFTTDSSWTASMWAEGYYGANYLHDGSSFADPSKYAKWTPTIPVAGNYNIYMTWTADVGRPNAAPLEIKYNGGKDTTKTVNQQLNNGTWVLIGTYNLSEGTDNYVKILASCVGSTIADAVKFEKTTDDKVATPTFSVVGGTYTNTQTITISSSTTESAIRYTTDGTIPSQASPIYNSPIIVSDSKIIHTYATSSGMIDSNVATASYVIQQNEIIVDNNDAGFTSDAPWVSSVGVAGYYGTNYVHDGSNLADPLKWAKWTPNIPVEGNYKVYMRWTALAGRVTAAPLEIQYNGGIDKTKTVDQTKNNNTWVLMGTYNLSAGTNNYIKILASCVGNTIADAVKFEKTTDNKVVEPIFSVKGGTYTATQTVKISSTTTGASIKYTINGSDPKIDAQIYTGPITVSNSEIVKAYASSTGMIDSDVATESYVINQSEIIVDNSDSGFTSDSPWTTITTTPGYYGINYAHDGNAGIDSSKYAQWNPNIPVAGNYNIYMRWTAAYNRPTAAPVYIGYSGGIDKAKTVDQTKDNNTWILIGKYNLSAGSGNYVKILASSSGYTIADAVKFEKTTDDKVVAPTFSVAGGTYTTAQTVTISTTTTKSAIRYTTDGTIPSVASPIYNGPITVSNSKLVKAYASSLGMVDSDIATVQYVIQNGEIIVDNSDTGFTSDIAWTTSTTTPGYYGINYAHDGNSGIDPSKYAKWKPNIIAAGDYNIYMRWTAAYNRPTAAPLEIQYNGGIDKTKTVDQTKDNNTWIFIGTYNLSAGSGNYVKISASCSGYTIADAVKFEKAIDVAAPSFSVPGGTYANAQTVKITSTDPDAIIKYAKNVDISTENFTEYTGPIIVEKNEVIRAFATKVGMEDSKVVSATYTINANTTEPQGVSDLVITPNIDSNTFTLSWTPSADTGITYCIYNGDTKIGTSTGSTFKVEEVSNNTVYNFTVRAKNAIENLSTASSTLKVITGATGAKGASIDLYIDGPVTLNSDLIYNNVYINSESISLNGHTLTINGQLTQNGAQTNINGGIMHIKKNYIVRNSLLNIINEGRIIVDGDIIQTSNNNLDSLTICVEEGNIEIRGSIKFDDFALYTRLSTVTVDGSIIQYKESQKQLGIYMEPSWDNDDKTKTSNITVTGDIKFNNTTISIISGNLNCGSLIQNEQNETSYYSASIFMADEAENSLTTTGDINLNNGWITVYSMLTVGGNLIIEQPNSQFQSNQHLSMGKAIIGKNLKVKDCNTSFYSQLMIKGDFNIAGKSVLLLDGDQNTVKSIGGSFTNTSSEKCWLTKGILEVAGDFTQSTADVGDQANFNQCDNFIVVLNGTGVQHVNFATPESSKFNILVIKKPLEVGYKFDNTLPVWNYLIEDYKMENNFGVQTEDGAYGPTGNFSKSFNDLANSSQVSFTRTYNSRDKRTDTGFGTGWSFSYEGSVKNFNDNISSKIVRLPDGSTQLFKINTDGTFTAMDSRNKLTKVDDGYQILTKDQHIFHFNSAGYLDSIKDRYGNGTTVKVDAFGKVTEIVDSVGRIYVVTYNSDKLIEKIQEFVSANVSTGRAESYGYINKKLVKSTDPTGCVTNYGYDDKGLLNLITDDSGDIVEGVTYNHQSGMDDNKVNTTTDQYGNTSTYAYDNTNFTTTITDSNKRQTIQKYDSSFNLVSSEDAGKETSTYTYYTDALKRNNFNEIKSETNRNGATTFYIRDDNGNITIQMNHDKSSKNFKYDSKNNKTEEKDENGKITSYIYDVNGIYLLKKVQPLNGTDDYNTDKTESKYAITTYEYYEDSYRKCKGLLKQVTDPNGNITKYDYDNDGNVKTSTDGNNKPNNYEYNAMGWKKSVTSPKEFKTSYEYNKNGNVIKTVLDNVETTRTVYDKEGRIVKEVSAKLYKAVDDDILNGIYKGNVGTRYNYNGNGTIESIMDANNNKTSFTYDLYGNVLTITKPDYAVTTYVYDAMNRVINEYYQGKENSEIVKIADYSYDVTSEGGSKKQEKRYLNTTATGDTTTATTTSKFDYANRLVEQDNADNTNTFIAYNKNGTVATTTDAMENVSYYEYDGLNRPTGQWVPFEKNPNSSNGILYTYTGMDYDKGGRKLHQFTGKDKVALKVVPGNLITVTYNYYNNKDANNNIGVNSTDNKLKSQTESNDNSGRKTEYEYDLDGNISKTTVYSDATTKNITEYVNNHFGKPSSKTVHVRTGDIFENPFTNNTDFLIKTSYSYDGNGNIKTMTTSDNVTTSYEYDSATRF